MAWRAIVAGLTIILAVGGPTLKAYAQDPSARCVSVANVQMTIDSAQGRGFYIENFSEPETVAFLKAFNATPPNSNFIATKMFAAVGGDRAYVFFESDKDLCTPPSPLSRDSYDAFVGKAQGDGAQLQRLAAEDLTPAEVRSLRREAARPRILMLLVSARNPQ
jgi:hypothetical protein